MAENYEKLLKRLADINNLNRAAAVLAWDQRTYMPAGGAESRAEQLGLLSKISHEMFTDPLTGELLTHAEAEMRDLTTDSDEKRALRNVRRDFDRETKIPTSLAVEYVRHTALAENLWAKAREQNDFAGFAPHLEKNFELVREMAELYGYKDDPYDALLDLYEPEMTAAGVSAVFAELKGPLVELVRTISSVKPRVDNSPISGNFSLKQQAQFTLKTVCSIGYDLNRGRMDTTVHPFCINFSRDDVRITNRYDVNNLAPALYGALHEMGHALYNQGVLPEDDNTPLGDPSSLGVHESQSRFWENIVGRSRAFAAFILPRLKIAFPEEYGRCTPERFYSSVNRVEPSLIRVEADEVTYNLHILLRFELEREVLSRQLAVKDLPEAWNARMQEYLGITPPDYASGVLQDCHWPGGSIGYFPTYTLGNLLSAQLRHAMQADLPDMDTLIEQGDFAPLLAWLRDKVHRHGGRLTPRELVLAATGEPLTAGYFIAYLQDKMQDIYRI